MMDFYSMEKIAFAKVAEERQTAAWAHLADKANAVRLTARKPANSMAAGLFQRFAQALGHTAPVQVATAQSPRAR